MLDLICQRWLSSSSHIISKIKNPAPSNKMRLLVGLPLVCTALAFAPPSSRHSPVLTSLLSHVQGEQGTDSPFVNRRDALTTAAAAGGLLLPGPLGLSLPVMAAEQQQQSGLAKLSDGTAFPLASFGLQVYDDETAYKLTLTALEVGYRNFFASVLARNQRGFARAVRDSGIPRSDLFICGSVVSNRASGFDAAYKATTKGWQQNMNAFAAGNIDYLDQIMLDYPGPDCESIRGQWRAFEEMHEQKLTKTLSVSNFSPEQLDCILKDTSTKVKPVVNQLPFSVAYHPGGAASKTVESNMKRGVLVQAWAPLGYSLGGRFTPKMKAVCAEIGKKYGKSFAQVALRWIVQSGASFTCQSSKKSHFVEDLNIFDFELTPDDMSILDELA
mmetsp:Transcript_1841/g.2957  ORF Transcript_1841/g.2957 Transcript_1841/m.2957 type:complete len:386 (-) Transcript_1841:425-1582(-)